MKYSLLKRSAVLALLLFTEFNSLAQDTVYLSDGSTHPCQLVRNIRKEGIRANEAGYPIENFYEYIVVEFSNDSIRILSPEKVDSFLLIDKNFTSKRIFYSFPVQRRSDAAEFNKTQSHPKTRIFYQINYKGAGFTLLSRIEMVMLEHDLVIFLHRHSDNSIIKIKGKKHLLETLAVSSPFTYHKSLRNMRGEWKVERIADLMKKAGF